MIIVAFVDRESVRSKCKKTQEKLIKQYLKNSTDGFPKSENTEQTLTAKRIGGKLKIIRKNFEKAVDTNKRSGGGRVVLSSLYEFCEKLWSGSSAVTSIENLVDLVLRTKAQNAQNTMTVKIWFHSLMKKLVMRQNPGTILRKVIILMKPLRGEVRLENY